MTPCSRQPWWLPREPFWASNIFKCQILATSLLVYISYLRKFKMRTAFLKYCQSEGVFLRSLKLLVWKYWTSANSDAVARVLNWLWPDLVVTTYVVVCYTRRVFVRSNMQKLTSDNFLLLNICFSALKRALIIFFTHILSIESIWPEKKDNLANFTSTICYTACWWI